MRLVPYFGDRKKRSAKKTTRAQIVLKQSQAGACAKRLPDSLRVVKQNRRTK